MKFKLLYSLIIFLICSKSFSQDNNLPEIPEWMGNSCENGEEFAQRDSKLGKYKLINFGLILRTGDEWEFAKFYENYLLKNYNIETFEAGCSTYSTGECYSKEMRKIIKTKYGDDFFERTRKEAKSHYKKEIQYKIDPGFIFNFTDEVPEFIGGEDSLFSFLGRNIKFPTSCLNSSIKGKVYCQFIIEKDGVISSLKIIHSPHKCFSDEVIRVMKLSPKWKPGTHNNQPVRTKSIIPVNFK
jgi:protein TonB